MATEEAAAGPVRAADAAPGAESRSAVLTEEELEGWGRRLGRAATEPGPAPGVFVALEGPLGAGKSTLVRAACRGAGVEGKVRSPTFTLHNHHRPRGRRPIHHVDLYRLEGPADLDDLGWDGLVDADGAVFVEWAERAGERLPADRWEIRLELTDDRARRRVAMRAVGEVPPMPALPGEDPHPGEDPRAGNGGEAC